MEADSSFELDLFSELTGLHIYTQICLIFPAPSSSHSQIISTLTHGLSRLSTTFPWVSGRVSISPSTGLYEITPHLPTPPLIIRDLRSYPGAPTLASLRAGNYPISQLPASLLSPRPVWIDQSNIETPNPVLVVQVNWVEDGLLLVVCGNHQVMGMTGQARLIHLLARACRDEPFSADEIAIANCSRREVVPLLEDISPADLNRVLAHQLQPSRVSSAVSPTPENSVGINLVFSASTLSRLKALAMSTLPKEGGPSFVSTDDTLTVFVWRLLSLARSRRLSGDTPTTLARAVDAKRYLDIEDEWPGLCQNMTYHTYTLSEVARDKPLGELAAALRSELEKGVGFQTRALATYLARAEGRAEREQVNMSSWVDADRDFVVSSWVKERVYEDRWGWEAGMGNGIGGDKAEAVRKPSFDPLWNLALLLPKREDGEVIVAASLRREDAEWVKWEVDEGVGKGVGVRLDE